MVLNIFIVCSDWNINFFCEGFSNAIPQSGKILVIGRFGETVL